jgi:hypothetical protein
MEESVSSKMLAAGATLWQENEGKQVQADER